MNTSSITPWARRSLAMTGLATVALLTACAGTPQPKEQMAVGKAAVERANASAAGEAPIELATARDKIARAKVAIAKEDYDTARRLALEAEADAALAEARARETRSEDALAEVRESIRLLRIEMNRS